MLDYPEHMHPYVTEQMRSAYGVKVRQSFRVEHRGYSVKRNPEMAPIIINNFNRVSYLKRVVDSLRARGYENLYVIDNNSTYEPLLDYYQESGLRVFYLDDNVGYTSLWRTPVHKNFVHSYYVYTDSDIEPIKECPNDIVAYFKDVMDRYPQAKKVGFSLKIDDLPEQFALRQSVIDHESRFWQPHLVLEPGLFSAPIDTTFALYRPGVVGGWWLPAIRTVEPYAARHLPWYADSANPSEEDVYYQSTSTASTHWTQMEGGGPR